MGNRLQCKAVAIIAREKIAFTPYIFIYLFADCVSKVFIVYKYHIVRRSVHALQKTITAVIDAVQHMGKIIIMCASDTITGGSIKHKVFEFFCEYQSRL